jgi:hypothetical protein
MLSCSEFRSETYAVLCWADSFVKPSALCNSVFQYARSYSFVSIKIMLLNPRFISQTLYRIPDTTGKVCCMQ